MTNNSRQHEIPNAVKYQLWRANINDGCVHSHHCDTSLQRTYYENYAAEVRIHHHSQVLENDCLVNNSNTSTTKTHCIILTAEHDKQRAIIQPHSCITDNDRQHGHLHYKYGHQPPNRCHYRCSQIQNATIADITGSHKPRSLPA